MERMTTRAQCLSYFLSILALAFPLMTDECYGLKEKMGYTVYKYSLPTDFRIVGFQSKPPLEPPAVCMVIAQLLILFFTRPGSHPKFLSIGVREIAAVVGGLDSDLPFALGTGQAKLIRATFANVYMSLGRSLLDSVLATAAGDVEVPMARVCMYVANFLKYIDMEALRLINDTLTNPISPVLNDRRIIFEVQNYVSAIEEVITSPGPSEYYGILGDPVGNTLLDPKRFPTLLSVAVKLNEKVGRCGNDTFTIAPGNTSLVDQLVNLHEHTVTTFPTIAVVYKSAPGTMSIFRHLSLSSAI